MSASATRVTSPVVLEEELRGADILIGAVLVPGGIAPKLVTREMVRSMGPGAVIVDVCIDQGGICETSRPTTHTDPIYVEEGVIHYCVANMPGAVPRTSTEALTSATLPYVLKLADRGLDALRDDPALAAGAEHDRRQTRLRSRGAGAGPRVHATRTGPRRLRQLTAHSLTA